MSIQSVLALPQRVCYVWICFALVAATGQAFAQESSSTMVDPSGTWRWEYDLDGAQYKDLVRLNVGANIKDSKDRQVQGRYESTSGRKIEIRNGKISGSKITFDFDIQYQGLDVKLEFEGTITKDSLSGNVRASTQDGSRDLPWAATRSVQADDVVGSWKMRIDANGTILEPVVTISKDGDKLKASYASGNGSGENVTIDVKECKIDKNDLCFGIDTDFQGQRIKADYRGRPYGNKIQGMIEYVLGGNAGEIDFTGARQSETK